MKRVFQYTIIGLFMLGILLPPLQQATRLLPQPRLTEKRQLTPMPSVLLESLLSGEFQTQFDAYMNDNFGFRPWMVMLNNQINITVFRVTR